MVLEDQMGLYIAVCPTETRAYRDTSPKAKKTKVCNNECMLFSNCSEPEVQRKHFLIHTALFRKNLLIILEITISATLAVLHLVPAYKIM